jgi:hypothetical protein
MADGRVAQDGAFAELAAKDGPLKESLAGS